SDRAPGPARDSSQPGDDHTRPAQGPLPDAEILGHAGEHPGPSSGGGARPGARQGREEAVAVQQRAEQGGATPARRRQCQAVPALRPRETAIVREGFAMIAPPQITEGSFAQAGAFALLTAASRRRAYGTAQRVHGFEEAAGEFG